MYCPNCGKETDGKFCQFCGAPLPQRSEEQVTDTQVKPKQKTKLVVVIILAAVALAIGGFFLFGQGKDDYGQSGEMLETLVEPTPPPESNVKGVSAEAYWKGMGVVNGFGDEYWKAANVEIGEIYIEIDNRVDDPTTECLYNMEEVFKKAKFVKTAQQNIDAITTETEGPDYEWERFIGVMWLMKAEGTISKAVNGEESAPKFNVCALLLELDASELECGDLFYKIITLTATEETMRESAYEYIEDPTVLDNLFMSLSCKDWLECGKNA